MKFPPPARYYVPLLVLVFGLAITGFDYELNLRNDLARNLKDVVGRADAIGKRLAHRSTHLISRGQPITMPEDVPDWASEPGLRQAVITRADGTVIDATERKWIDHPASETPLAPALKVAKDTGVDGSHLEQRNPGEAFLYGAYPFAIDAKQTGWALIVFDRTDAVTRAQSDALQQLIWLAGAIFLLCALLWIALHYGLTARLSRMTAQVRDYGAGERTPLTIVPGSDEIHELSVAFAGMASQLATREVERRKMERAILEAPEREQRRIGQDLHDGLGQQLTAASLATNALITTLAERPEIAAQAERLSRLIRGCISEVRALSHGLAPVALEGESLTHALSNLAELTTANTGVRCVLECEEAINVPDSMVASHLYRIAQEAVNNALKHGSPREIRIGLARRGARLVLEVEDDGEGLPEKLASGGGIGLRLMRHRSTLIGANFNIDASPAGGTRIACDVALPGGIEGGSRRAS